MGSDTRPLNCGINLHEINSIDETFISLKETNADFFIYDIKNSQNEFVSYSPEETDIYKWTKSVVAKLSAINAALNGRTELDHQLSWASHLSIQSVLLPKIADCEFLETIRVLNQSLNHVEEFQGEVWIPFAFDENGFDLWYKAYSLSVYKKRIFPVIELTDRIPNIDEFKQWFSQDIRLVLISIELFQTDESGSPCLSDHNSIFLETLMKNQVTIALKGDFKDPSEYKGYLDYLKHLNMEKCHLSTGERMTDPYRDYLQVPIQPLRDNLSAGIYEVFERDPIKYLQYQKAIFSVFKEKFSDDEINRVLVIGPGRGPFIKISLLAAKKYKKKVKIVAIEKNEFAFLHLEKLKRHIKDWAEVELVLSDSRDFNKQSNFDLIVSELLGSFGDNELSPEILDSSLKLLKENGVVIPESYTSFVAPACYPTVWDKVRDLDRTTRSSDLGKGSKYEVCYVVNIFKCFLLDEPKECFNFIHDKGAKHSSNDATRNFGIKSAELLFKCNKMQYKTKIHGFVGFFEAVLYKNIRISTNPPSKTEGMDSWFPVYFPIMKPMMIRKGDEIKLNLLRNADEKRVWYEWYITEPKCSLVHNVNGRSFHVGK